MKSAGFTSLVAGAALPKCANTASPTKSMSSKPCSLSSLHISESARLNSDQLRWDWFTIMRATHQSASYTHKQTHTHTHSCFHIFLRAMFSEMDLSDGEWRHTYQCVVLDKAEEICNGCTKRECVCVSLSLALTSSRPRKSRRKKGMALTRRKGRLRFKNKNLWKESVVFRVARSFFFFLLHLSLSFCFFFVTLPKSHQWRLSLSVNIYEILLNLRCTLKLCKSLEKITQWIGVMMAI